MWVENAQRDHADFVAELRARGVEVVELHDAARRRPWPSPGREDWLLDRKIIANQVGLGLVDEHPRLPRRPDPSASSPSS